MPKITIHNAQTGEILEREMTQEETSQWEADQAKAQQHIQAEAEAQAKRESALAKLQALGLNEDDLKALGL